MEHAEYGDPTGTPVIFLHSILYSRKKLHPFSNYAESHGLRIIRPERPGFGYSDPLNEPSQKAYADDIRQLADQLNISRFHIVGDASAGPIALACCASLQERVIRAAIISCIPSPRYDEIDGLIPFERMLLNMGRTTPASFHSHFAKIMMKGMQKNPDKYYDKMFKHLPDADQEIVSKPEKRAIFFESIDNAFPARVDSFATDYLMRLKEWDFSLEEIQTEVDLWHGIDNRIVSISSAERMANELPNCRARFLESEGHYLFISHWDQILEQLTRV